MNFSTIIEGEKLELNFSPSMDEIQIINQTTNQHVDCISLSTYSFSLILNDLTYYLTILPNLNGYEVSVNHHPHYVQVNDEIDLLIKRFDIQDQAIAHSGEVHAQIPGLVSHINVQKNEKIKIGDTLCILEAMKMENEIKSPLSGTINEIHVNTGSNVEKGDLLMEISN